MEPKPDRPILRWLIRLSLAGVACLLGAAIGIVVGRKEIATRLANDFLDETEFESARLQIDALEWERCRIVDLGLATDSAELRIERIEVRYSFNDLRHDQRLQNIHIEGVHLQYDLTGPSTFDPKSLDELIQQGLPFPLDRLDIERAHIELQTDFGTIAFDAKLALWLEGVSTIQGTAQAATSDESVELEFSIGDKIDFKALASVDDILASLERYGIDLDEHIIITEGSSIEASNATLRSKGSFEGITPDRIEFEARLGPARLQDLTSDIAIESVGAKAAWQAYELVDLSAAIQIENASMETLRIGPSRIEVDSKDLKEWHGTMTATDWNVEDALNGTLQLETVLQLTDESTLESISAELDVPELTYDSFSLKPFSLSLEGALEKFILSTSELASREHPWLRVAPTRIELNSIASENATATLKSVVSAASSDESKTSPPIEGRWKLDARFAPNREPQTFEIALSPETEGALLSIGDTQVEGDGDLKVELQHWARKRELATTASLTLNRVQLELPAINASGLNLAGKLESRPIPLDQLSQAMDTSGQTALAQLISEYLSYRFDLQGAQANIDDTASFQWFAAGMESTESPGPEKSLDTILDMNIGIANAAEESLQQIALQGKLSSDLKDSSLRLAGGLLFEGEPAQIELQQSLRFDELGFSSHGSYSIQDIRLISSDILSRYSPTLIGSAVSANIGLEGELTLKGDSIDTPTVISITDGSLTQSANDVNLNSIQGNIAFDSLADLTTLPSQIISIADLQVGDIEASDLKVMFQLDTANRLIVEDARVQTFDGMLALEPFALSLEDPQAAITLNFNRISVAPAIAMLDFFDGTVTGRLNGSLPINIVDGYPVLGEGYLELDPSSDAQFSYNAQGYFSNEDDPEGPKKALGDKLLDRLELEPNGLLERALGDLTISDLRVDLFSKDLPETPMRIQLAGIADAGNAEIPLNITTNVNGTVAELLNFLMRLDSLGLVTE